MKIILITFLICAAIVSVASQLNNGFPTYQNAPNINVPNINDICSQPGANCQVQSRFAEENSVNGQNVKTTRVCDQLGCIETRVSSSASQFISSLLLLTSATFFATLKYLVR